MSSGRQRPDQGLGKVRLPADVGIFRDSEGEEEAVDRSREEKVRAIPSLNPDALIHRSSPGLRPRETR